MTPSRARCVGCRPSTSRASGCSCCSHRATTACCCSGSLRCKSRCSSPGPRGGGGHEGDLLLPKEPAASGPGCDRLDRVTVWAERRASRRRRRCRRRGRRRRPPARRCRIRLRLLGFFLARASSKAAFPSRSIRAAAGSGSTTSALKADRETSSIELRGRPRERRRPPAVPSLHPYPGQRGILRALDEGSDRPSTPSRRSSLQLRLELNERRARVLLHPLHLIGVRQLRVFDVDRALASPFGSKRRSPGSFRRPSRTSPPSASRGPLAEVRIRQPVLPLRRIDERVVERLDRTRPSSTRSSRPVLSLSSLTARPLWARSPVTVIDWLDEPSTPCSVRDPNATSLCSRSPVLHSSRRSRRSALRQPCLVLIAGHLVGNGHHGRIGICWLPHRRSASSAARAAV